jgi:hypothetical protein
MPLRVLNAPPGNWFWRASLTFSTDTLSEITEIGPSAIADALEHGCSKSRHCARE